MKAVIVLLLCSLLALAAAAPRRFVAGGTLDCGLALCFVDPCAFHQCPAGTECRSCNCVTQCKLPQDIIN